MRKEVEIKEMIDQLMYDAAIANEGYGFDSVESAQQEEKRLLYGINMLRWVIGKEPLKLQHGGQCG